MTNDYYKILGVNKSASDEEIKKRFAGWRINIIRTKAETKKIQGNQRGLFGFIG